MADGNVSVTVASTAKDRPFEVAEYSSGKISYGGKAEHSVIDELIKESKVNQP